MRLRRPVFVLLVAGLLGLALPASAAAPGAGTITKAKRSAKWSGGPFMVSDPAPDPSGFGLYAPSCRTSSSCDHFVLKIALGNNAKVEIRVTTPNANPPGGLQQPVTGDDYDLYVYDPSGRLISSEKSTSERGNEKFTITHLKKFNGKAYDVAVRPWAVMPGSSYSGSATVLSVGR
jgi:hypothetical protein